MNTSIISYKGFEPNMTCRSMQYEIGKTYTHNGAVKVCKSGFHACEYPLDVFNYYSPAESVYCVVEQSGTLKRHRDDSKVASSQLTVKAAIALPELIAAAIEWIRSRAKPTETTSNRSYLGVASNRGKHGMATNTGKCGVASNSGSCGVALNIGSCGVASNSGSCGVATNTGKYGVATNIGYRGVALNSHYLGIALNRAEFGVACSSGDSGVSLNSGDCGMATNSGDYGMALNSGHWATASALGKHSVVTDASGNSRVRGVDGCALFAVRRTTSGSIQHAKAAIVGKNGIKPDTWYTLDVNGRWVIDTF